MTPPYFYTGEDQGKGCYAYWVHLVYPYVNNEAVFICPTSQFRHDNRNRRRLPGTPDIRTSYGYNAMIGHTANIFYTLTLSQIKRPSDFFMISDSKGQSCLSPFRGKEWCPRTFYANHHSEGVNVAFADGHVKWVRSERFWAQDEPTFLNYLPWSDFESYPPGW